MTRQTVDPPERATRSGPIPVVVFKGVADPAAIVAEIHRLNDEHQIYPGGDRIILFDHQVSLANLSVNLLYLIRDTILECETAGGRRPNFRTVLVNDQRVNAGLVALYKAIWDKLGEDGIEVTIVGTIGEAIAHLRGEAAATEDHDRILHYVSRPRSADPH